MLNSKIIKLWPIIDERDKKAVLRVLEGDYLCGGEEPEVIALEKEWSSRTMADNACTLSGSIPDEAGIFRKWISLELH